MTRQLLAEGLVLADVRRRRWGDRRTTRAAAAREPSPVDAAPRLGDSSQRRARSRSSAVTVMLLAIIMALVPGRARDARLGESLRSGRRLAGGAQHITRSTLVVVEVSVAVMLLISAGLLARSLVRLLGVDAGFDASHLLTLEVDAVGKRYADDASVYAFHDRVRDAVRALPGVVGVTMTNQMPLGGNMDSYGVVDADNPPANPELAPSGDRYVVSTDFFSTMRIPMLRGRAFTAADLVDSTHRVVLLSAALAERLWPGADPIGRHIQLGGPDGAASDRDRHRRQREALRPRRHDDDAVVRPGASVGLLGFAGPAHRAHRERSGERGRERSPRDRLGRCTQPIIRVATMDQVDCAIDGAAPTRVRAVRGVRGGGAAACRSPASTACSPAASPSEREEIGLRSRAGRNAARDRRARRAPGGARMASIGIVLGLAGALALTRFLRTMLFGVAAERPDDALRRRSAILGVVTLAACAIPALRAVRIDPSQALRDSD